MSDYVSKLLVAAPNLTDPFFRTSIILLGRYNAVADLLFGFALNKGALARISDIALSIDASSLPENSDNFWVYNGGPMPSGGIVNVLHTNDYLPQEALEHPDSGISRPVGPACTDTFLTPSFLQDLLHRRGPKDFFATLNTGTWDSAGLAAEIEDRVWGVLDYDPKIVFAKDSERAGLWDVCRKKVEAAWGPRRPFLCLSELMDVDPSGSTAEPN